MRRNYVSYCVMLYIICIYFPRDIEKSIALVNESVSMGRCDFKNRRSPRKTFDWGLSKHDRTVHEKSSSSRLDPPAVSIFPLHCDCRTTPRRQQNSGDSVAEFS